MQGLWRIAGTARQQVCKRLSRGEQLRLPGHFGECPRTHPVRQRPPVCFSTGIRIAQRFSFARHA